MKGANDMPTPKDILLPVLISLVTHGLQLVFGLLVAHNWLDKAPGQTSIVALALYLVGFLAVLWLSVWMKLRHWLEKRLALALPSGSSADELKAAMQNNSIWSAVIGALRTNVPIAKP